MTVKLWAVAAAITATLFMIFEVWAVGKAVAQPQATTYYIHGYVYWGTGSPCRYCDVIARNKSGDTRAIFPRVTDAYGHFSVPYIWQKQELWGIYGRYDTGGCHYLTQTVWRYLGGNIDVGRLDLNRACQLSYVSKLRTAQPSKHPIYRVCPEGPDGYPVARYCIKDRWP